MKSFLGLWGLLPLLPFMKTCADDWTVIHLQCTNYWFYLRIKAILFFNIYMEPDEVFLGIGCPVSTVWPNDVYDFTYPTYSCGIVNKVINDVILLETKLIYISRNGTLRSEMQLSCVMHSRYPLICDAECCGDFTGNPPAWEVDMTIPRHKQAADTRMPNFSTSNEEPQASGSRRLGLAQVSSFTD